MRLRRLALTRYGRFTDRVLDFGPAVPGAPDLHIVYGPNEAGKSTAFAGFLDLLFGIEQQSRYNFLHPYDTMRVGGCLELPGGLREVSRVKRRQNSLLDAAGQPVPDSVLLGALGGLDRAAYRTMFSLDDDTLEAGGDSILASNGELGQLLFSASAGLSALSQKLLALREQADGFTRPNARSGELHQLKAGLAALKQEREAVDTLASEYARLATERERAAAAYDVALAAQSAAGAAAAALARRRAALPRLAELRRLRDRLPALADLPLAPPGWLEALPALDQDEARHRSATGAASAEMRRLAEAVAAIVPDPEALALAGALEPLETLSARFRTAELDLPLRQRELARAEDAVAGILARLGRAGEAEPGRLQLSAAQAAALDALMETRSGIDARLAAAAGELAEARLALAEARRALPEDAGTGPPPPALLAAVATALQALRDSDHARRLRDATRAGAQQRDALDALLHGLLPWTGDAAALAALRPPEATTVAAWQEEALRHAALLERRREDAAGLAQELALRQAELDAAERSAGLPADREVVAARGAREAAWAAHRRALDATTAEAFEAALRQDDLVSAARLGHERERARLHETAQAVAGKAAALARAQALLAEAEDAAARHAAQVAAAATAVAPALAGMPPAQLLAWLARRDEALQHAAALRQAAREEAEARADAAALQAGLSRAMAQAALPPGPNTAVEALAIAAQAALDREARLATLRQSVEEAGRELRRRDAAQAAAEAADAAWMAGWRDACRGCWLGEAAASLPFGAVRGTLAAAAELGPVLAARDALVLRIQDMQEDQDRFRRELHRLAAALAIDPAGQPSAALEQRIAARVQQAQQAEADLLRLRAELALAEAAEREARTAAEAHAARIGEMMQALGASSLIELGSRLRDAQDKAALEAAAAEAERELLATLQAGSLPEAMALLDRLADAELELEQRSLSVRLSALEAETRECFAARREAEARLAAVGGDDAVARIEERRRTQLLEIEDRARRYLQLRLGIAAADRALRAYRDRHRSAMMTAASEAFRLISRGAYRGLGTQPGRDGDILVALAADGASKLAADLSKGTRFQLYLALRAAGYGEFARLRPPVPFVADDIMETFDDFRAEETLKLLGEMSRLGQVIYLTHHDHLRALARRAVPEVRLHDLSA